MSIHSYILDEVGFIPALIRKSVLYINRLKEKDHMTHSMSTENNV